MDDLLTLRWRDKQTDGNVVSSTAITTNSDLSSLSYEGQDEGKVDHWVVPLVVTGVILLVVAVVVALVRRRRGKVVIQKTFQ